MKNWLQDFEYSVPIQVSVYVIAGLLALMIAWLTVGYQTLRAAYMNPVQSIRNE